MVGLESGYQSLTLLVQCCVLNSRVVLKKTKRVHFDFKNCIHKAFFRRRQSLPNNEIYSIVSVFRYILYLTVSFHSRL